jgi:hypothetical protein
MSDKSPPRGRRILGGGGGGGAEGFSASFGLLGATRPGTGGI